jgi:hypothetical protein
MSNDPKQSAARSSKTMGDSWLEARRRLGNALTEWRDAGAHPETVVFAIEDLFDTIYGGPAPETEKSDG